MNPSTVLPARIGAVVPNRTARIIRPLLRVVTTVSLLLILTQPVLAGRGLDGDGSAIRLHFLVGVTFLGVAIVQDIVAILAWKPAGGPGWIPVAAVTSHLLGLLQMEAGHSRTFALHLPVGIALVLLAAALVAGSLRWRHVAGSAHDARDAA